MKGKVKNKQEIMSDLNRFGKEKKTLAFIEYGSLQIILDMSDI